MLRSVILIACTLDSLIVLPSSFIPFTHAQSETEASGGAHAQNGVSWGIRGAIGASSFGGDTGALMNVYENALDASSSEIGLMPTYSAGVVLFVLLSASAKI